MNLFVITTPFQILGAEEAIYHYNLKNNILILVENKISNNQIQMNKLIDKFKWNDVVRITAKNNSKFLSYIEILKKYKKYKYEKLFLGDLGLIQKIFAFNIDSKNIILLDDGTTTMKQYEYLKENKNLFKIKLKMLRFVFFGLNLNTKVHFDIFTMFNLKSLPNCKIIQHNFDYFKKKHHLKQKLFSKDVYIIGQKLVTQEIVDKELYYKYLDEIYNKYKSYKINYLLHRSESIDDLIDGDFHNKFNIIESNLPGEVFFINLDKKPLCIIGSVSALLFTLNKIFDDLNVISYQFDLNEFKKGKDLYKTEYKNMNDNNINIVKFKRYN